MSTNAKAVTILVVDDDPGLGRLIVRELSREGYRAEVAASGTEAMGLLATQRADLLLLDLKLPDINAPDFIRKLAEAGLAVPFVIITGQGDERVAVDMMKRGALDYLVKDRNFMDLVPVVVDRALSQLKRMQRTEAAEKRTREIGEQMAAIVGAAMDAIISVDENQKIVLFNHAAEKLFLCSTAEAIGRPIERFLPARFREAHRAHIKRFGETGETTRMMGRLGDVTGVRANGEEFPVEASISQVQVDGGKLFTVILRDITSRMQKDAALRQQAELLQLSHDAIIVWRVGAGIEFWSAGASKLYGHPPDRARGAELHELLQTRYP
jgi:PAS domain S-box-containing protein